MADSFYKILDKNGIEIPDHYTGRRRTYEEAKKMVDGLNKNGEHSPYTMIEINRNNMAQQTAVDWLASQLGEHIIWEEKIIDLVEQAKAMERDQILDAHIEGQPFATCVSAKAEQYYNETYGGEK